jgi:hypothetical protein
MGSRTKRRSSRSRARNASVGALLGAAAALAPASCDTSPGIPPPIDYDAGTGARDGEAGPLDGDAGTLVDLDAEADAPSGQLDTGVSDARPRDATTADQRAGDAEVS